MKKAELPEKAIEILNKLYQKDTYSNKEKEVISRVLENNSNPGLIDAFEYFDGLFKKNRNQYLTQWEYFIILLVDMAFIFTKEPVKKVKDGKIEIQKGIKDIKKAAKKLSRLMKSVDAKATKYGYERPYDKEPFDLMIQSAKSMRNKPCNTNFFDLKKALYWLEIEKDREVGYRFQEHVIRQMDDMDELETRLARKIFYQLDGRYIPNTINLIDEIANIADKDEIQPTLTTMPMEEQSHKYNIFLNAFFSQVDLAIRNNLLHFDIRETPKKKWVHVFSVILANDNFNEENLKKVLAQFDR